MRWPIVVLVVMGLVAALSAALLTAAVRAQVVNEVVDETGPTEVNILVTTRDLKAMTVIDASSLAQRAVLSTEVPPDAVTDPVQVIGRILVVGVLKGEALTLAKIAREEDRVHLAAALPEGGRAMSVTVATDMGVENLLYPGAIVDVVASFRLPASRGTPSGEVVSATLLQALQVLAVGEESVVSGTEPVDAESGSKTRGGTRRTVVTLLVDSQQAEALQLAMMHGSIALVLRNPLDTEETIVAGLLLSNLSGDIAHRLGMLAQSGMASGPVAVPTVSAEAEPETAAHGDEASAGTPAQWITEVLRGRERETRMFPLDEAIRPEVEQP